MEKIELNNTNLIENETPINTPKRLRWVLLVIMCVGIVVILLIIKLYLSKSSSIHTSVHKSVTNNEYHDRGNYFHIQIPKNWQTSEDIAQSTTGLHTSKQATHNIEETQLELGHDTGIAINVYEGTSPCPLSQPLTTTIAGLPASYDPILDQWTIPTTQATITVTISYPGGSNSMIQPGFSQEVTIPPPSVVAQNKKNIMEILKTLKLANLVPLKC